jgi:hypothetical protein
MRLFGHRDYRLVIKGRDDDRDRRGSAGVIIIIGARRVGDGPFIEAVCTVSVQKNCHHSYSLVTLCGSNMGIFSNYTRRSAVFRNNILKIILKDSS